MDPLLLATRAVAASILIVISVWIFKYLGGLKAYPHDEFFNFHPLLMVRRSHVVTRRVVLSRPRRAAPRRQAIAFVIFMTESVLSFRAPPAAEEGGLPRATRKRIHFFLHVAGLVSAAGGLAAVFLNHRCARPSSAVPCLERPDVRACARAVVRLLRPVACRRLARSSTPFTPGSASVLPCSWASSSWAAPTRTGSTPTPTPRTCTCQHRDSRSSPCHSALPLPAGRRS